MRVEPAGAPLTVPRWAVAIVCGYLSLVGLSTLIAWRQGAHAPPLCVFRAVSGRPCPTCCTTRMVLAVVRGDLGTAVACNPLMFTAGVVGLALLALRVGFGRRVVWITSDRSRRVLTVGLVTTILVNWLYLLRVS